jgi:hypothetical protein
VNSRDRILAATSLEELDRVPCSPHVSAGTVQNMPGSDWQALLQFTDVTMSVGALGDLQIFGGQQLIDASKVTREADGFAHEVETPRGVLRSRQVVTPDTTWTAEYFGKTRADIDKVLSISYEPPQFDISDYLRWTEVVGDEGLVSVGMCSAFRFCLGFFGPQTLYLAMGDAADLIEHLVATMNERLEVYITECCEGGVRSFWMGGSEHCGPGVVNPRLFSRMVTPYDKRIVEIIHEADGVVNYHTHGRLKDILEDIAEISVDVMSPIEAGLRGDVTLAEVKNKVGDGVCLKGNLDDMAFLAVAPEDEVRAAAEGCIRQAAEGGGYMLSGTDAGIYSPGWVQSFLVMAKVAEGHTYQ